MALFGLFKSKEARLQDWLQKAVDSLRRMDSFAHACIALQCSALRLAEVESLSRIDMPGAGEAARLIFYDPPRADPVMVVSAFTNFDRLFNSSQQQALRLAGGNMLPLELAVLLSAQQQWRCTFLACIAPLAEDFAREMWSILASGFSRAEEAIAAMRAGTFRLDPEELAQFERAIADGPRGPDYRRIPIGFG
jgi:hypothetical protein